MQRSEPKLTVHSQSNQGMQVIYNLLMLMIGRNETIQSKSWVYIVHVIAGSLRWGTRITEVGAGQRPLSPPPPPECPPCPRWCRWRPRGRAQRPPRGWGPAPAPAVRPPPPCPPLRLCWVCTLPTRPSEQLLEAWSQSFFPSQPKSEHKIYNSGASGDWTQ